MIHADVTTVGYIIRAESSPGSFDEFKTAKSAADLYTVAAGGQIIT